jgi:2-dehydropantoate 2-reductase
MRIIIYGAGGIGCVVGGHLGRNGQDVILIGRSRQVNAINTSGLKLITPTRTYQLAIPAVTSPDQVHFGPDDVIFLTMKSQDTALAVKDLREVIADIPIFCLQNGVRNEEMVSTVFPRVYGAMIRIGAEYLIPGEVLCRRDPPGWLVISRYPQGNDEICEAAARSLRQGGFLVRTVPDAIPYKWGKLLANLGNAVDAITGGRGSETEQITKAAGREFKELLQQAGVRWISQEDSAIEWPEISQTPRSMLKTAGFSSTWQSLERQQGSVETEFLNGEIVRLAKKMGRSAPINEKLLKISQEMASNHEKPGKYNVSQLQSILGLT